MTRIRSCLSLGVWLLMAGLLMMTVRAQAPSTAPTNLAQGKTATASSSETNHLPADANDGKPETRWCAADGNTGAWWKVDLGAARDLDACSLTWESDGKVYKYIVEGSADDKEWKTLSDQKSSTAKTRTQQLSIASNGKGIRYVRVTVTGLEDRVWASINEVVLTAK